MALFKVSWWIHGAGRIVRGFDIVEAPSLTEDEAEQLIEKDLSLVVGSGKYDIRNEPQRDQLKLPKFYYKHQEVGFESHHSEVSNWKVMKVTRLRNTQEGDA